MQKPPSRTAFRGGGLLLGFGLGGLADGIVLHQVLQWHNLVIHRVSAATQTGLRANVFWDGVFHLVVTIMVVAGMALLWRAVHRPGDAVGDAGHLIGLVLVGWGGFHVADQVVFHVLLRLHDIRVGVPNAALYNWGFLGVGLVLALCGLALLRSRGPMIRR